MKIRVFTDGACSKNGQAGARASYAFWIPEHKELSKADFVPSEDSQTNNRGELLAIYEGVKCIYDNFPAQEIDLQVVLLRALDLRVLQMDNWSYPKL
jgi:ribonuclease HI